MRLSDVLPRLLEPFAPEEHRERELKGGGQWWYVPWQTIRERLNQVCPEDWTVQYDEPKFVEKWCYIGCTVVICGVSRHAIGSAEIELISSKGRDMSRGNPIERAIADAFKNACEQFGIAAYLDDQSDPKKREAFARFMHQRGHGKAMSELQREAIAKKRQAAPISPQPSGTISEPQKKRLWAIAKNAGYTNDGAKALVESFGFESSAAITQAVYDQICEQAASAEQAALFNEAANNKPAPT